MTEEQLTIVDEKDQITGYMSKSKVLDQRLLHRGTSILVLNSKGEIFVHQRAKSKPIFPGYYDMFVGGGVAQGETYESNARKELEEELGVDAELQFLFKMRYTDKQIDCFVSVFKCSTDAKIKLQKEEIIHGKFLSFKKLNELIKKEKFCTDSLMIFQRITEEHL